MKQKTEERFEVFLWNDNFATHIPIIDQQHQQLVALLNKLASSLVRLTDVVDIEQVFVDLIDYVDYHFKIEEAIWREYFQDDPWYLNHLQTHHSFSDIVADLELKVKDKDQEKAISDIVRFLMQWLAFHILDQDRRMAFVVTEMKSGLGLEAAKPLAEKKMSASVQVLLDTVLSMYGSLSSRTMELMREKTARKRAEEALKINEQRWQFIMESSGDEIWDWDIGSGELYRSDSHVPLLDLLSNKQESRESVSKIHPDDLSALKQALQTHLDGNSELFVNEHRVLNADNTCQWVLTKGKVISRDASGQALRMVGTHINMTERETASLLFQNSSEGMMVTDMNNNIITVNPAFTKITGYTLSDVVGKKPSMLKSGRHSEEFFRNMWQAIDTHGCWQGEIWNRKKDGTVYLEWLTINNVYNPDDSVQYRMGLFFDITEKKAIEEAIWKQANFDVLTGLPNRQMFYDRFLMEISMARREQTKLALLYIDLDRFKEINDTLGHSNGNQFLIDVAKRLESCVRESDTVARLCGDEFTVILRNINTQDVPARIAGSILNKISEPFIIDEDVVHVSASIGISIYPDDSTDKDALLNNADQALYQAKQNGRNRMAFFTRRMQETAQYRNDIANDLKHALNERQFELAYQPIVELNSGRVQKAEALIRWRHPVRGIVNPGDFICIAENTGVIHDIGNWVFYECERQVEAWQQTYCQDFQISINKSPLQFHAHYEAQQHWLEYLNKRSVSQAGIILELNENLLSDSTQSVYKQLDSCVQSGLQLALDDFGTGFSSLTYLQKFNVGYIKIDQSFIADLAYDDKSQHLCRAMVQMAHALDIKVIAEGVETEAQRRILKSLGCDYGQGFLFSAPVAQEHFESFMQRSAAF